MAEIAALSCVFAVTSAPIILFTFATACCAAVTAVEISAALPDASAMFRLVSAFCATSNAAARFVSAVCAAFSAVVRAAICPAVRLGDASRFVAVTMVALICVFAFVALVIAVVSPVVSPPWTDPPVEVVPDSFAVFVAFPLLLAALLAEFVPDPEPLALLFEPVPDFEPPFFDFEPVWIVFMSGPA